MDATFPGALLVEVDAVGAVSVGVRLAGKGR